MISWEPDLFLPCTARPEALGWGDIGEGIGPMCEDERLILKKFPEEGSGDVSLLVSPFLFFLNTLPKNFLAAFAEGGGIGDGGRSLWCGLGDFSTGLRFPASGVPGTGR